MMYSVDTKVYSQKESYQEVMHQFNMTTLVTNLKLKVIFYIVYSNTIFISLISANNSFHCNHHGQRICPKGVLTFVCRVSDGAATIWRGNFFNCPSGGNEIILRHSQFENGFVVTCNDGAISVHSTEVTNNSYTSQLNVTVNPEMNNGTVECIQDSSNVTYYVGACMLILATGTKLMYYASRSSIITAYKTTIRSRAS